MFIIVLNQDYNNPGMLLSHEFLFINHLHGQLLLLLPIGQFNVVLALFTVHLMPLG